jgi:DNA-binding XRE family transcriptional regulator
LTIIFGTIHIPEEFLPVKMIRSTPKRPPPQSGKEMYDFSILRELRKGKQLSILDVSSQSGVSPAVISKLERNQTLAELETLFKLSRVFGMSATDLLGLAESRTAHKKGATVHRAGGFEFSSIEYGNVRALRGKAPAGAQVSRPEMHRDDYEVCWILSGKVLFRLPTESYALGAGEAIQFDAILDHTYEALEDCELIIIHLRKAKRF